MKIRKILTHPGSAHKDDFLACSVLAFVHGAPIERRDPTAADLEDPTICVVDVGEQHDAALGNFDHHQFPREHEPACALSLILQHLGLYEDAQLFCEWLEPAEWFDSRGLVATARWLGVPREVINKLNSPMDVTLLRRFALAAELHPGETLWQVMCMLGEDLINYLKSMRERLDFIAAHAEWWTIDQPDGPGFEAVYLPRTDPLPDEPTLGLPRYVEMCGKANSVITMIYPDRRGKGYGMSRYHDSRRLDFTRISDCDDVHFAHSRGFVAKTSATDPARLKELLAAAYVGE